MEQFGTLVDFGLQRQRGRREEWPGESQNGQIQAPAGKLEVHRNPHEPAQTRGSRQKKTNPMRVGLLVWWARRLNPGPLDCEYDLDVQLFEHTTRTRLTWARQVFILETAVDRSFPAETPAAHWRFQIVWRSPF